MRRLMLVALGGCSFANGLDPATEPVADAAKIDAPPTVVDARPAGPPCMVGVASATGTDRGRVGGDGGGANFGPIICSGDDRMVGIAVKMSNQTTTNNGRSAHALLVACAPVTIMPSGEGVTGTVTMKEVTGAGNNGWSPSTLTPTAMCPAGWVVNGLEARTGTANELFKEVRVRCGQLDVTGATIASQVLYVSGSLTEPAGIDTVACAANEIVVQIANRTGSGFDSANLFCAPAICK